MPNSILFCLNLIVYPYSDCNQIGMTSNWNYMTNKDRTKEGMEVGSEIGIAQWFYSLPFRCLDSS